MQQSHSFWNDCPSKEVLKFVCLAWVLLTAVQNLELVARTWTFIRVASFDSGLKILLIHLTKMQTSWKLEWSCPYFEMADHLTKSMVLCWNEPLRNVEWHATWVRVKVESLFHLSAALFWWGFFSPLLSDGGKRKMFFLPEAYYSNLIQYTAQQSVYLISGIFWWFLRSILNYYPLSLGMKKNLKKRLTSSGMSLNIFKLVFILSLFSSPSSIMNNWVVVINNCREKHLLVHLSQSVCFSWTNGISQFFQVNIFPLLSFQFQILSRRIFIVS